MPRLRLKNLQDNSDFLSDLNICADDPRLAQWVNAFEQQALPYGRWWGTTQLVQFCLTDSGCLVLPRQIAVIEAANLSSAHTQNRNAWYDFIKPHAPCVTSCCSEEHCGCGCGQVNVVDHGTVASFRTTTGVNKKIRVYPGNAADAGKKIIFQGKDANGVWVRTTIDGARADGEQVTLAMPFVDTVTVWGPGAPFAVMKEVTEYRVLVFSVNQDDATETQLADYEPGETEPSYRRVNIPGYCSPNGDCECSSRTFKAIVSLEHIPVRVANDWLLFCNIEAYRQGIQSIKFRKEGNQALADAYFFGTNRSSKNARGVLRYAEGMGALPILRAELRKYTADITSINVQHAGVNLIGFL